MLACRSQNNTIAHTKRTTRNVPHTLPVDFFLMFLKEDSCAHQEQVKKCKGAKYHNYKC